MSDKINDLKPFEHGQEGTHYSCDEQLKDLGGKAMCCGCTGHKCNPNPTEKRECEHSWIQDADIKVCYHCGYKPFGSPPTVESWEKKLSNLLTKMSEHYLIDDEFEAQLKWFISTQIQQAEERLVEKFREVIGEDEVKKVVPPNKDDSYDSLNAQFKVMKYNQEQLPIRNQLREEQKAKMDEFLTKLEEEK